MSQQEAKQDNKTRQMVIAIVVIVVLAAVIFGGGAYLLTRAFGGNIKPADEYETVTLVAGNYTDTLSVSGEVRSSKTSSVVPEVKGTVSNVAVAEGDKVSKGDVLMTLKNDDIVTAEKDARKAYNKALKNESKVQASYDKADKALKTAEDEKKAALRAAEKKLKAEAKKNTAARSSQPDDANADTAVDSATVPAESQAGEAQEATVDASYDAAIASAQSVVDSAKTSLDSAKSTTSSAEAAYNEAKKQRDLLTVKAGESGTIINLEVEKGMSTDSLDKKHGAMQIADLKKLIVVAPVPEADISGISQGQEAKVTCSALSSSDISALVLRIADTPLEDKGEDGSTLYNVTFSLEKISKAKVGMMADVSIVVREYGSVFHVPSEAVRQEGEASYVKVLYSDATMSQHQVTVVGTDEEGQAVISSNYLNQGVQILSNYNE